MTSLGFEAKSGAIFQMITDLDADGNGTIDFGEWFTLMTKRVNDKDSRANINKIFALYDDERTGYISIKNLRRVAQELSENISEEELQELINRADIDGDGLVSEEEFYTILTRPIKQWVICHALDFNICHIYLLQEHWLILIITNANISIPYIYIV